MTTQTSIAAFQSEDSQEESQAPADLSHLKVPMNRMETKVKQIEDVVYKVDADLQSNFKSVLETMAKSNDLTNLESALGKIDAKPQVDIEALSLSLAKIAPPPQPTETSGAPLLIKLIEIEERGNIGIDFRTGDVEVKRDIPFDPKKPSEEPLGEFKDEALAREILFHLYEVWTCFKVKMRIEGHTKGGEDDFWQTLADNRANLIVKSLANLGVDESKMSSKGLPGKLGLNKVGVVVKLDIFPNR
eukprot:gnl/MRDRNA2_/MRDRNA2_209545_c0_seq1.p1 gnl/MRDRNA2_/MRDRNA2_209545_c0~~gnl/MRDRNA2_/MRDRNA2_209545_c0_seq1.p1  ORF type:complete len:252 (-),score=50.35 gnl/MRDRNA2_/MRDRNA2_209545_c0_seq1:117-851(-)